MYYIFCIHSSVEGHLGYIMLMIKMRLLKKSQKQKMQIMLNLKQNILVFMGLMRKVMKGKFIIIMKI